MSWKDCYSWQSFLTLITKETEEKKQGRLYAKEYNELADRYNKLIDDKAELERKNREKAYEVMCQQEHSR